MHLTGWVRNRSDGSVELLAEGEEADLLTLQAWCAEGPGFAVVRGIEEKYSKATGEFTDFTIEY